MISLLLQRDDCGTSCSLGKLYVNGVYLCETLEDVDRKMESGGVKEYGRTAIPRGTFKVVLDFSQRFKKIMPHVLDVPGFAGIRIHPGNSDADTDGCILVGVVRSGDRIINSRTAYNRLMIVLETAFARGEAISLVVA